MSSKDKVPSNGVLPLFLKHLLIPSTLPFSYPMRQQGLDKTCRIQQPHPSIATSLDLVPPPTDYSTIAPVGPLAPTLHLPTTPALTPSPSACSVPLTHKEAPLMSEPAQHAPTSGSLPNTPPLAGVMWPSTHSPVPQFSAMHAPSL